MINYGGYSLKRDAALKPFLKKSLHAESPEDGHRQGQMDRQVDGPIKHQLPALQWPASVAVFSGQSNWFVSVPEQINQSQGVSN